MRPPVAETIEISEIIEIVMYSRAAFLVVLLRLVPTFHPAGEGGRDEEGRGERPSRASDGRLKENEQSKTGSATRKKNEKPAEVRKPVPKRMAFDRKSCPAW